ncbi:PPOX class F420-dependent oxidoreductase [Microbacteriaceae bacterium VKM Ac-2854]|nr:PPOX class F420-dependent oxidoreductase [Microbacteriaceae bacterium VKM Ac-2854]
MTSFDALAGESFVSLTTFRTTGVPVSTPVWIARDGAELVVTTPKESGKVKRIRNSGRVELTPCDRRGRVTPGAATQSGHAVIQSDAATVERLGTVFLRKYRLEYRIFLFIERLVARGNKPRVILRIAPTA